jgi:hypothetical protein
VRIRILLIVQRGDRYLHIDHCRNGHLFVFDYSDNHNDISGGLGLRAESIARRMLKLEEGTDNVPTPAQSSSSGIKCAHHPGRHVRAIIVVDRRPNDDHIVDCDWWGSHVIPAAHIFAKLCLVTRNIS